MPIISMSCTPIIANPIVYVNIAMPVLNKTSSFAKCPLEMFYLVFFVRSILGLLFVSLSIRFFYGGRHEQNLRIRPLFAQRG